MTTVAASTGAQVVDSRPERSRLWTLADENVGFFSTWLRVLWRHWPVLLTLALAGTVARELLLLATFEVSPLWQGLGTWLVLPLVPLSTLLAMILMLRVARPSLPYLGLRAKPEPLGVFLASATIPFLLFYFTAEYAVNDIRRFGFFVGQDILSLGDKERFITPSTPVLVGLVVGAFLLRALLARFSYFRTSGLFAIPLAYLEIIWLYLSLISVNNTKNNVYPFIEQTRGWRTLMRLWHAQLDPNFALSPVLNYGRNLVTQFLDAVDLVIVAPVIALIAGSIVLAARTRYREDAPPATGVRKALAVGAAAGRPVGGRFGLLADGLRRVFQSGVVATMLFCLAYLATKWASPMIFQLERLIIGPRDDVKFWSNVMLPFWYFNDAIGLVLLMALIAAFVDRSAARIARRAGAPTSGPSRVGASSASAPGPSTGPYPLVPEQATVRLGPPPSGGATPGTPSFDGFSPVRPTYTPMGQPAPTFGDTFGSGPRPAPTQASQPPSATPPAGLTSGLWDVQLDKPGGLGQRPGDDERGRPGVTRQ